MSQNPPKGVVEVASHDLLAVVEILDAFAYEPDEDSCMGMSFFTARLSEDWFFHVKWKLESILKSSANVKAHTPAPTENL
jgi:hypothetical protein